MSTISMADVAVTRDDEMNKHWLTQPTWHSLHAIKYPWEHEKVYKTFDHQACVHLLLSHRPHGS